jgi:hypothetical protein
MKKVLILISLAFVFGYSNNSFNYNTDKKSDYEFDSDVKEKYNNMQEILEKFQNQTATKEEIEEYLDKNISSHEKFSKDVIIYYAPNQEKYMKEHGISYYKEKESTKKPWWKFWGGTAQTKKIQTNENN